MMGDTPKKVVKSFSECFTCLSPLANQNKISIFRKSSVHFPQINRSALNVVVSCYSNSSEFFSYAEAFASPAAGQDL